MRVWHVCRRFGLCSSIRRRDHLAEGNADDQGSYEPCSDADQHLSHAGRVRKIRAQLGC